MKSKWNIMQVKSIKSINGLGLLFLQFVTYMNYVFLFVNFWSRVSIFEAMEANSYHSFVAYKVFVFVWSVRSNITFMLPILSLLSNYFLTPIIFRNRVVQIIIWFGNIVLCFSKSIIKIYRIITKTSVCRSGLWGPLAY